MTLRQTLQKSTSNTNELFTKLLNTSNQAVKSRESVFAELSRELRLYVELEREHLFPVLRKHPQTKDLVSDATKANKELLAALDDVEALPKGDNAFVPRVTNLRKLLQQHLKDERQEMLPAVEKALSDEEAEAVTRKIEAAAAEAQEAERAVAEDRRLASKLERDRAKEIAERQQAVADAVVATAETARDVGHSAAEAVRQGVKSVGETSQKVVSGAADAVTRVAQGAGETLTSYRDMARDGGQDVKAVASAVKTLAGASSEVGGLWLKSLTRAGRNGLQTSFRLVRNPLKMVETQREFVTEMRRNLLETTNELLQIARRASGAAVQPVEQRLQTN